MNGGFIKKGTDDKSQYSQVITHSYTNDNFIKFKVFEMMQSKNGGQVEINKSLIKKIQSISNQQTYFSTHGSNHQTTTHTSLCFYKMLKCESKLIRFILELNGLQSTDRHDWNMLWTHTQGKTYFYERLNATQKINHFPLSSELTRKDRLAVNIIRMQKRYSKTYFNFIPETFVLPDEQEQFEQQFDAIDDKMCRNGGLPGNIQRVSKQNLWIVKPTASSQGKGIFIIDDPRNAPRHEACVVSRYIDNPLLLFGHKFDLRIYVVVTCYDPLRVYVYREGLVRFASEKYKKAGDGTADASVYAHLTNYSINKKNEEYVQNDDAADDDSGFKWSLSALQQYFKESGIDVNLMWSKINDVIIKSLLSIEEATKNQIKKSNIGRNNCYELFGYDILLDNYLNPWLLEINLSPSLAFDSPLDLKIKANLIKDTFNLIGLVKPQFRTQVHQIQVQQGPKSNQKFQTQQAKQIQNEIQAQLKDITGLNWIQKEYLNQFSKLPTKLKEILIETMLEHQRRGNFVRIYPTKNSDFYDCFLSQNKQNQQSLYTFLYSEVFFSFKDATNTKNLFVGFQMECDSGLRRKQRGSGLAIYAENNGSKIAKELLYEYFTRVIALLKEARVARYQDCPEMIEILGKLNLVMKDDCLRFDEDIEEEPKDTETDEIENKDPEKTEKQFTKPSKQSLSTIEAQSNIARRRMSQVISLESIIDRLIEKNKKIHEYVRKIALLELRKQAQKSSPSYSNVHLNEIQIPEPKIKAYLSGSSQKILQQCQQSYLIKQIERHVCGSSKIDKGLFQIQNRLVLDYLGLLKNGKKPSTRAILASQEGGKPNTKRNKERSCMILNQPKPNEALNSSNTSTKEHQRYYSQTHKSSFEVMNGSSYTNTKVKLQEKSNYSKKYFLKQQEIISQQTCFQENLHQNKQKSSSYRGNQNFYEMRTLYQHQAMQSFTNPNQSLYSNNQSFESHKKNHTNILNKTSTILYEQLGKTTAKPPMKSPSPLQIREQLTKKTAGITERDERLNRTAISINKADQSFSVMQTPNNNSFFGDSKSKHSSQLPLPLPHQYKQQRAMGAGIGAQAMISSGGIELNQESKTSNFNKRMRLFDSRQAVIASQPTSIQKNSGNGNQETVLENEIETKTMHIEKQGKNKLLSKYQTFKISTPQNKIKNPSLINGSGLKVANNASQISDISAAAMNRISKSMVGQIDIGQKSTNCEEMPDIRASSNSIVDLDQQEPPDDGIPSRNSMDLVKKQIEQTDIKQNFKKNTQRQKFVKVQDFGQSPIKCSHDINSGPGRSSNVSIGSQDSIKGGKASVITSIDQKLPIKKKKYKEKQQNNSTRQEIGEFSSLKKPSSIPQSHTSFQESIHSKSNKKSKSQRPQRQIEDLSSDYYQQAAELYQRNAHFSGHLQFHNDSKRQPGVSLNELMVNKTGANLAKKLREQKDRQKQRTNHTLMLQGCYGEQKLPQHIGPQVTVQYAGNKKPSVTTRIMTKNDILPDLHELMH